MITLLDYLSKNRIVNLAICFAFYLLVTLPHEQVGVGITAIFKGVSRKNYDLTILSICVVLLLIFGAFLFSKLRELKKPLIPLGFFSLCILLMILSLNLLIIVNIEIIHFIQYALMAILLFPLCRNFLATLSLVTLLGAIDEAYQYYYLSPQRTNYYDFNDVILNLLGAALGLTLLRSHYGIQEFISTERQKIHKQVWIMFAAFISFFSLLIWQKKVIHTMINRMGLSFDWKDYWSVLIRKETDGFWTEIPPKIIYHVVQPVEGVVIVSLLLFIYSYLYYQAE